MLVLGTPGTASTLVGSGGQATYGMAIVVPPGVAAMAPNLSLSYSDGGVNGPVGVGWSVQGVSTITRCGANRSTDGYARNVAFDGNDKLCLDGQRLIQTDASGVPLTAQQSDALGLSGSSIREYRTEKDTYARIRAYGTAGSDVNYGPASFKVWTKSGQLYEYGLTSAAASDTNAQITRQGSRPVVMVWAVRRISDSSGNYMDFKYLQREFAWGSGPAAAQLGKEWNLAEVQYTGNATTTPSNKVVFSYDDRSSDAAPAFDRAEAYQFDNKNVSIQRLSSIQTYINSPNPGSLGPAATAVLVKRYSLTYDRSSLTGRSRVREIKECAGAAAAKCLPPVKFTYTGGTAPVFARIATFGDGAMGSLPMLDPSTGAFGILTGDFDGDGRTDILRWSTNASQNELYKSTGAGGFEKITASNVSSFTFFSADQCFYSMVADFNGDGLSDVLRYKKGSCPPGATNVLYLSTGDGNFTAVNLSAGIDLSEAKVFYRMTSGVACPSGGSQVISLQRGAGSTSETRTSAGGTVIPVDAFGPGAAASSTRSPQVTTSGRIVDGTSVNVSIGNGPCMRLERTQGRRFYILDLNGDGILDIVTTIAVGYDISSVLGEFPPEDQLCAGQGTPSFVGPCTRIYFGSSSGTFTEGATNVAAESLYSHPVIASRNANPYWRLPDQADIDGDGLQDILALYTGRWRSLGDGSFASSPVHDSSQVCGLTIDFNGDGRGDCLRADSNPSGQSLRISMGAADSPVAQFNLTGVGDNLYAADGNGTQIVGAVNEDFDGDGRQDILRWGPTGADTGIYLSKGDGSFRARSSAGLNSFSRSLQAADGSSSFVLGDFLGNGAVQILHLKSNPTAPGDPLEQRHQLYARSGVGGPVDALVSVTSPTGLVTTVLSREALPNSSRYIRERVLPAPIPATSNVVDVQPPMYVITSVKQQTGVGDVTTEYLYKGLKFERGGRGMLGFHETRQQSPAPDGSALTVATQYMQTHPYTGVAAVSKTYLGVVGLDGARLISQTTNSYCDKTARDAGGNPVSPTAIVTGGQAPAPCVGSAKVQRPYVYQTWEEGWELSSPYAALPKVVTTNSYNDSGDPLTINVVTTGTALGGLAQTSTKLTTNTYQPDNTAQDYWILGRLSRATVLSTVPNSLPSISTSAGNSPSASARSGTGSPPAAVVLPAAVLSAILQLTLDEY